MNQFKFLNRDKINQIPKNSGIYALCNRKEILYIGKAINIRERVKNHVLRTQQPTYRDGLFINQVKKVGFIETDSEIEALILEASLIKKYQPKYNVVWKDDKNYFFVGITRENYPRVFITHQPNRVSGIGKNERKNTKYEIRNTRYVGPFVDGKALKQTLKVLRKVFPYRSCKTLPKGSCLWYQLNRCSAPCLIKSNLAKEINLGMKLKKECQKNIKNLISVLEGKSKTVLKNLQRKMKSASISQNFEKAAEIRDRISALERIMAHAKIFKWLEENLATRSLKKILKIKGKISRIEAYDVSNIQGEEATGSMVVFINGQSEKSQYRKFKIKIGEKPNDVAMIKEILSRRLKHSEWPYPDLILIDGGIAQMNAGLQVLKKYQRKSAFKSAKISVLALAKKKNELYAENQKKPTLLKTLPREIFNLILQLRDEAHRFAISYHHKLRKKALLRD